MKLEYPVLITKDETPPGECSGLTVTVPDIPEAVGHAWSFDDAIEAAQHSLDRALSARLVARGDIPLPSSDLSHHGIRLFVAVSPSNTLAAKVMLWQEMCRRGINQAALARLMGKFPQQISDKLLDPASPTTLRLLEEAFAALGKRLVVEME